MTILGSYDDSAHCRARASASSRVAATRTMERSGLPEPSRLTHAIQCGPRASLWISYEPEAIGAEIYQNLAIFALRLPPAIP